MSGTTNLNDVIRTLKEAQAGGTAMPGMPTAGRAADSQALAFQAQMRMAQQAMGATLDSGDGTGMGDMAGLGLDASIVTDAMMMDALTTIARLTGQGLSAQPTAPAADLGKTLTRNPGAQSLGSIAAMFESGEKGIAAIGFDRTGGTSYGKFQISSRAGTMNRFINYLAEREPDLAERLRRSGPANTGSTAGRMPAEWAKIAAENPERFERVQTEFIKADHYQPAREKILASTGVDIETAKPALREALFSTAVQHGASGAARIFNQAIDKFLGKPGAQAAVKTGVTGLEQALVSEVYSKRQHQFGGSTPSVRASVQGRLRQEKDMVLAMLDKSGMSKVV